MCVTTQKYVYNYLTFKNAKPISDRGNSLFMVLSPKSGRTHAAPAFKSYGFEIIFHNKMIDSLSDV